MQQSWIPTAELRRVLFVTASTEGANILYHPKSDAFRFTQAHLNVRREEHILKQAEQMIR